MRLSKEVSYEMIESTCAILWDYFWQTMIERIYWRTGSGIDCEIDLRSLPGNGLTILDSNYKLTQFKGDPLYDPLYDRSWSFPLLIKIAQLWRNFGKSAKGGRSGYLWNPVISVNDPSLAIFILAKVSNGRTLKIALVFPQILTTMRFIVLFDKRSHLQSDTAIDFPKNLTIDRGRVSVSDQVKPCSLWRPFSQEIDISVID